MEIGLKYTATNAQFAFPPNDQAPSGEFIVNDTPLRLSVTPGVAAVGRLEAHLVPAIKLGLSALGDTVAANVFLNLDASAILQLGLEASVALPEVAVREVPELPAREFETEIEARAPEAVDAELEARQDVSFGGCVTVFAGLSINAGAEGTFFAIFDANVAVALFSQEFQLFQQCFGAQAAKRSLNITPLTMRALEARQEGLFCPAADQAAPAPVTDQVVPAANIAALK